MNNGEVLDHHPPVQKNYANHSTLLEQFEDYGGGSGDHRRKGVMAVIDSLTMLSRT